MSEIQHDHAMFDFGRGKQIDSDKHLRSLQTQIQWLMDPMNTYAYFQDHHQLSQHIASSAFKHIQTTWSVHATTELST